MISTGNETKSLSIVLIDDEPSVLLALKLLLKALGYEVREFSLPKEALVYLAEGGCCDIILSDLRMPELDGIQLLEQVKISRPEIPFILISGHATEEDVKRATALGASGFLGKPFSPKDLQDKLAEVI